MLTLPVEKKVFLIDAMALIYRSYFAFIRNPLINSKKFNTSASYGFTSSLLNVLKNEQISHIAVVFDTHAPTERHIQFKEYKAQRQETPKDILDNLPYIHKIIEGFNIHAISLDGYEADDIIGTMATQLSKENFVVYIMSADKDYGQLLKENIFIYKPGRSGEDSEIIDSKKVCEKWQIQNPQQVIDILGLMGDTSDNIPGVPGIGEKTAAQLIHQFGSIENIYQNIDKVKGKLKDKLIEYKEQAFLSKQLATINLQVPIEYSIDELKIQNINREKLLEVFKELEFKKLAVQVLEWSKEKNTKSVSLFDSNDAYPEKEPEITEETINIKTIENTIHHYYCIQNSNDEYFQKLLEELQNNNAFAFDTETDQLNPFFANIVGMSFAIHPHTAYYIHLYNNPDANNILNRLKPFFQDKNKILIGQNIKYDYHILKNSCLEIHCQLWDTMVAHFLINPDSNKHNLNYLSETFLNYSPVKIDTLIGNKKNGQISMSLLGGEEIKDYAAEDADIALQLKHVLEEKLKQTTTEKIFQDIEMPLIPVLVEMERNGIKLDTEFLSHLSYQIEQKIAQTEKEIYEEAGMKFNIASPKQVGEILFEQVKIDESPKKTKKTGQYATSEDVLIKLKHKHPIVEKILNFRELIKLKTTYVDALPKMINPKTQRLHTTFNQAVAATGRLSSDNPNLQNIPIRSELGQQVRKAFIASDENHVLLSADYSQIELRIAASLSKDESMIEAFKNNKDIHTATAAKIYGLSENEVTKEMRHKAKSVNFGIIYGQGPFGLAESLGISRTEAKNLIQNYFEKYPSIKRLMEELVESAKKKGYTETLLGRKRWLPAIHSANKNVRANAERIAINTPIQGTAADIIKIAMINIHQQIKKYGLKTKMLLQIHDELLFEVPHNELEVVKDIVKTEMQNAITLEVPIIVNLGVGQNWLDAH